jgi:hypothetical protein
MKYALLLSVGISATLFVNPGLACGIEGTAIRSTGSNVDGSVRVSTGWNSQTAYPRNGRYSLDLGASACGAVVEVFVNGNSIGRHHIPSRGYARVDITMRGASDYPVR